MSTAAKLHHSQPIAVSVCEASELSGVGKTTIYKWIGSGRLKSFKVGNRRLIRLEALQEWITSLETSFSEATE